MNFATLLGDSVSAEVIAQLEEGMATTIKNAVHAKEVELTEQATAYAKYVQEHLEEKAEAYGEYVQETLSEQANEYGAYLQEDFAMREVEYVERIEEVKQAAEGYAELIFNDLVEKADSYTEQFVEQYKAENVAMFEAIQGEQHARDVVESISSTLASFGFDTEQNAVMSNLKEALEHKEREIATLNSKLYENDVSKQKALILEEMTSGLSLSERQKVTDAAGDVLTESISGFKNIVRILVDKYDSNDNITERTSKKINERVNTSNMNESVSFKGTYTSNPSVSDIASTLI